MRVTLRITSDPRTHDVMVKAVTSTRGLGEIVIATARNQYECQRHAARFLDANFPGEPITWDGGYHGGDSTAMPPSAGYWKD